MKKILTALLVTATVLVLATAAICAPRITGKTVEYTVDGAVMKSYLAYDEKVKGQRPGVLVLPEWWGVNDYVRGRARMLAELGYAALAVDMYGDGRQTLTPDEAQRLSSEVMKNFETARNRFTAGMEYLKRQPIVRPGQMAAIGYCFGGGVVLNMARQGLDLKGGISFHGALAPVKPAQPGKVKAKILVLTGGDDPFVPAQQVEAFKREMESAGADLRVVSYPGATHSFTNPAADNLGKKFNMPVAYNADADRKSWNEMKRFLEALFKKE